MADELTDTRSTDIDELTAVELAKEFKNLPRLTKRQQMFVDKYLETGSPYEAAVYARYSKKSAYSRAYQLLSTPKVAKAIELGQKALRLRNNITQDYFVTNLKKIIENNYSKTSDKISALTLLARVTGFIKERAPEAKQLVVLKQEFGEEIKNVTED